LGFILILKGLGKVPWKEFRQRVGERPTGVVGFQIGTGFFPLARILGIKKPRKANSFG